MSYIDIIITAAYPDRIETTTDYDHRTFINGLWNYECLVVGSDLEPEDFQRLVRDNSVLRFNITENE